MVDTVAALGSLSKEELEAMRSLSKQRLPIQSKHVEALLEYVEQIQREARDKALEEAANLMQGYYATARHMADTSQTSEDRLRLHSRADQFDLCQDAIRALKDKGE